jgi:hypothetical protein
MAAWISGERGKAASLTTGSSSWESAEQLVNSWPGSSSPGMNRGSKLRNKNYFEKSTLKWLFFFENMYFPDETQQWAR